MNFRKLTALTALFFSFSQLNASYVWTDPQVIDLTTDQVFYDVTSTVNPATGEFLGVWVSSNPSPDVPFYSTYPFGGPWISPTALSGLVQTASDTDVYASVDPTSGAFLITWTDNATNKAHYAIYQGGVVTVSDTVIPGTGKFDVAFGNVFSSLNTANGVFLVTWRDGVKVLTYATFDGATWSSVNAIPGMPTPNDNNNTIFSSVNSNTGTYMVTWRNNADALPYYTTFDGMTWGTPAAIPGANPGSGNIFSSADPTTGNFFVTYAGSIDVGFVTQYAIYNGTTWTAAGSIPGASATQNDVISAVKSSSGDVLITWRDSATNHVIYAIYNQTNGWIVAPTTLPTMPSALQNVYCCYDPLSDQFLATWADLATQEPTYAFLSFVPGPNPPTDFIGFQKTNDFGLVTELYNTLEWQPSSSADVTGYSIFRDGTLIDTLPSTATRYEDHNRHPGSTYTYLLNAMSPNGTSSAVSTTVGG